MIADRRSAEILAHGHNRVQALGRKTAHAEMVAFASAPLPSGEDLVLVSTLEPCIMCYGACIEAAIGEIWFGLNAPADSGTHRVTAPSSPEVRVPTLRGGVLASESRALFERFVRESDPQTDTRYARQLLALT